MKPFFQTAVIGLMLLAASSPLHAASTLRFGLSVISVSEATGHAAVHVLRSGDLDLPGLDTVVMRYTNAPPGGEVELWTINTRDHGYNFNEIPGQASEFAARVVDWLLAHPKQ